MLKDLGAPEGSAGRLEKEGECDKDGWGKCLPANQTKLSIAFGGKNEFTDVGQYILTVYNYALVAAGILAVVMIIIAGAQWTASGGSSEIIGSAKKRIVGSVVGLLIAYLSYVILNTINPALVNLRLPQVYLVRPFLTSAELCRDLPGATDQTLKFAPAASASEQQKDLSGVLAGFTPESYSLTLPRERVGENSTFACGTRFFANSVKQPCFGDVCRSGFACVKDTTSKRYDCKKATIAGTLTGKKADGCAAGAAGNVLWGEDTFEGWEYPDFTDEGEQELWVVCKDGALFEVKSSAYTITGTTNQFFGIIAEATDVDAAVKKCKDRETGAGLVLKFEMNEDCDPTDEEHWIGVGGKDLGDDGFFMENVAKITKKYFFEIAAVKAGNVVVDFDVGGRNDGIHDIDNDEQRNEYYKDLLSS